MFGRHPDVVEGDGARRGGPLAHAVPVVDDLKTRRVAGTNASALGVLDVGASPEPSATDARTITQSAKSAPVE